MKTPVALFIFRRPDTTEKVFEAIRQAKPPKLLVVADGPRPDRPGEAEKCAAARAIIERVDWECEVLKNYSDINLGAKQRGASAISWVFEQVEEAIILEDDCIPHPTFFRFCEELLDYYRDDKRIMAIAGDNSRGMGQRRTEDSYYFSRLTPIWGWATWRRAWQYYDVTMKLWPMVKEGNWLRDILRSERATKAWSDTFDSIYEDKIDAWDYQWTFACWLQSGINVVSNLNLISNCGFNAEATHTTEPDSFRANAPLEAMNFPLQHPPFMICDTQIEELAWNQDYPDLPSRIQTKVKKIFKTKTKL
jgi:hypothetical protein